MNPDSPGPAPPSATETAVSLPLDIAIHQRTLRIALAGMVLFMFCAGLAAELLIYLNWRDPYSLIHFFGLSYEENLPTWYSSMLAFSCAAATSLVAVASRRRLCGSITHWWVLAIALALVSLDEVAQKHEDLGTYFDYGGVLYYGWIIPAGIFVVLFGLSYLGFLLRLPPRIGRRLAAAGATYVLGALILELPLGYLADTVGTDNLTYGLIDLTEETLEMIGLSLFLDGVLLYLAQLSPARAGAGNS